MRVGRFAIAAMLIFALVAVSTGIYVCGYLWLGEEVHSSSMHDDYVDGARVWIDDGLTIQRNYPHQWQARVFQPATKVEAWLRGCNVEARYREPTAP